MIKRYTSSCTVADESPEVGEEAGNGRLHVFLSSFWASLGGVFGGGGYSYKTDNHHQQIEIEKGFVSEMGSRAAAVVLEEAIVGGGKPKNAQAEGRNRRVLRDIGNLISAPAVEGKPQNITRSFGMQTLAKAQEEAVEKNNFKKPLEKDCAAKAKGSKKEHFHKPNKQELIVISSDEEESDESAGIAKKTSKKPNKTLTGILTARGKAACGLTTKKKIPTVDIDAGDVDDELAAVEYVEDMYRFYKLTEEDGRVHDYMDSQPEVNCKMRAILVDWLIEVHKKFKLMPESLYLTINILDRFLSLKMVPREELQLVGISSMLIACKYEEIWAPEVSDFIAISDNAYTRQQVLLMEKAILRQLEWYLTVPTPYVFLTRYIKASAPEDDEMEHMTLFFAELGLVNYSTSIEYNSSKLSASAVYAARCTLNRAPLWTETLQHYTGYSENQLLECAKRLVSFHSGLTESSLKAVRRKYSNPERLAVAMFPAATTYLLENALHSQELACVEPGLHTCFVSIASDVSIRFFSPSAIDWAVGALKVAGFNADNTVEPTLLF
ncbi:Cyclin-B1-4 [Striga hermonthica]|uniref:Cyclin-B1-4 n=1 Tax=Striga hermonthica TaxID=68872 RepID=A0A9N7NA04_STRHE|nr:Cyclin-B1-4 [Striga hermonthica]